MSDGAVYCRLCAELKPKTHLISAVEDVGITAKIPSKMQWINIDISAENNLPKTICVTCFDALDRCWIFLHKASEAQLKLNKIFINKEDYDDSPGDAHESGNPVNLDWDSFKDGEDTKTNVKQEVTRHLTKSRDDSNSLVAVELSTVKVERMESDDSTDFMFGDSDSDQPLQYVVEVKKHKKKKRLSALSRCQSASQKDASLWSTPVATWDDYMCRCAKCDAQCPNIASLQLHSMQIHMCCSMFKCSDCNKVYTNFKRFINHVRHLHNKLLRYCCEICNKCFSMATCLKKHRYTAHSNDYAIMCPHCGTSCETAEQLEEHMLFYSKSYRKKEDKEKIRELDLKCGLCHKVFKSRSNLQQHKLVHTERSRDFSCDICGKTFFTKGSLGTHMLVHQDSRRHKCDICNMAFRARGNLINHTSLHSDSKPFVCEQCGKSFRVKRHLKSHSIVHTDLMPYTCHYCNKPFRFKTRLNMHLRQHTGAKPYHCVHCQRDFTNGSNFKKHMKRRHNIDTSKRKSENLESTIKSTVDKQT